MDYETNYLLKANVFHHSLYAKQAKWISVYFLVCLLCFFFLLFKPIQVYPMKACWKSKSLKCRECCIMGCFDLCTGVEERSNSKQQSSLEVEQQTVHNWIITHRTSGSLDCCLGDTVNPNVSRSSQQRVRSCFRWYCCPAAACLMSLPSC